MESINSINNINNPSNISENNEGNSNIQSSISSETFFNDLGRFGHSFTKCKK